MSNESKTILAVTGIRSEYDILSSVFRSIDNHPELNLKLVVTGAHLSPIHSMSINNIKNDGFEIVDEIENLINSDTLSSRVKGLAIQMQSLIESVKRVDPDLLLILGDREEAISTAIIGSYMNIPIAHICGGDRVIGNVDDQIRHAVSKLSHIHFVSNEESYNRLIKMGEQPFRVFNTGNPGLDRIINTPHLSLEQISENINFNLKDEEPFIILIQHVISTESQFAEEQIMETMIAIENMGIKTVMSYPNSDPGFNEITKVINKYKKLDHLKVIKNIPRVEFINLMRNASCMLGNSSAGIMESPILKLPVVNIGNRQIGRLHAENVQFVKHNAKEIETATKKAIYDNEYQKQIEKCKNPYGDGQSSDKIANILAELKINKEFFIKDITY